MNINDTVRVRATGEVATVTGVKQYGYAGRALILDIAVVTDDGKHAVYRACELEPGYDLRPDIARLPPANLRLATVGGVLV